MMYRHGGVTMIVDYMVRHHLNEVIQVERASWTFKDLDFGEYVHPLAWNEQDFTTEVKRKNTVFFVVSEGDYVSGFACISKDKKKNTNTVERLVINPLCRRHGMGTILLNNILSMSTAGAYYANVREHDDSSIAFYSSLGWSGKLSLGLYGPATDGIVFQKPSL
jgi:ribosomal protein S18 acetylase RimI-like enzyme